MTQHGLPVTYNRDGCRCPDCTRAVRQYQKLRRRDQLAGRPRRQPATGTIRRLRALAAIGWPTAHIASRLGTTRQNIAQLHTRTRVWTTTAQAIAALYDELCMTPGPSTITRRHAGRHGWPSPLAWDEDTIDDPDAQSDLGDPFAPHGHDPVAVDRALSGEQVALSRSDRAHAVARLAAAGLADGQIAERLHITTRSVLRIRARHHIPPATPRTGTQVVA